MAEWHEERHWLPFESRITLNWSFIWGQSLAMHVMRWTAGVTWKNDRKLQSSENC